MPMKWKTMQMPKEVQIDERTQTGQYGRFVLEPLERGFGITLGHALRRVLLSSIQGAAPIGLRVDGVLHEFTSLPGVYEDVTGIVLNVKQLRVRMHAEEGKMLVLEGNKKGSYKAKDLQGAGGDVEVLNPDLHLVELTEDVPFRMEIDVDFGRSYVLAEQNKRINAPAGTVALDSLFSPVVKVNYDVENTRVGQRTDFDRLTMEITTDGSVTPRDALCFAAQLLREHLQVLIHIDEEIPFERDEAEDEETNRIRTLLKTRVDELELSVRSSNCLRAANIQTLEDLVRRSESEMLKFRNFGRKSLNELNAILSELGLSFGMDVEKYSTSSTYGVA
jgi:DNA-directed RNA polymerase subunit alpha